MRGISQPLRVLLILPCYNESGNIGRVLREIIETGAHYDTLVVDDGSIDSTYQVASALSAAVTLPVNLGIGGAVQTGIKYAAMRDYDVCIQVDGDGQHLPSSISVLIDEFKRSPANLLIGSRFLSSAKPESTTLSRRFGISVISMCFAALFGRKFTDPTSGFRLMDREAIRLFEHSYPHDFPEPISIALALERGLVVRETPVEMRARSHGRSSIVGLKTAGYMLRVIGYLTLIRMGRHLSAMKQDKRP